MVDQAEDKDEGSKSSSGRKDAGKDKDEEGKDEKKPSPLANPVVRISLIVAAIVIVVLLIIYLVYHQTRGKYYQSTNDAEVDASIVSVSPQVSGYIHKIFVPDNRDIKVGQPLIEIDARSYQAQVDQYKSQVDVGLANAESYKAQVREQRATVAQSERQYASSLASARFQSAEAKRYAPLAESGAETKENADKYRSQAVSTGYTASADAAQAEAARRKIGSLESEVSQALAQAQSARAQQAAAQLNVDEALVRATIDGRTADSSARVGQYVSSGTKLLSIVPISGIYVTANFKETQLGIMRTGQPATIKVDALPGVSLRGHVMSSSPGTGGVFSLIPPQNASGNFTKIVQRVPVKIAIDAGPDARKVLVPGLSVTVTVDTIGAKNEIVETKRQEKERKRREDADRPPPQGGL